MKKFKVSLILVLLISLSFGMMSSPKFFVSLSADDKSEKNSSEGPKLNKKEEQKKTYFQLLGEQYGEIYATRDFARKLKANNRRHFSSKREFDKTFNQEHSSDSFSYHQFRKSFMESYDIHYITLQNGTYANDDLWWFMIAKKYGEAEGQIAALHDFVSEKEKNWANTYKELLKDKEIFERFHLSRFDKQVTKDFELQFRVFFQKAYEIAYLNAIDEEAKENTNYEYVTSDEKMLVVAKPYYDMKKIETEKVVAQSKELSVYFPKGTVYDNSPVGIPMALKFKERTVQFADLPDYLLPQTDIFVLDLQRGFNSVEFYQAPKLIFKNYMQLDESNAIGVYKWKDGRWKYIPTIRDAKENALIAPIKERFYRDTDYAVFYDKKYKMPSDIVLNWAFEALDVAVRRHHIRYEAKLRPDDVLTRDELADLIYRTIAYKVKSSQTIEAPKDVKKEYQDSVSYCLGKGYLTAFPDGTFKPDMPVRYDHFGIMMNRIYGTDYNAEEIFMEMRRLGHQSNYFKHDAPFITRAEAVYVLYKVAD